MILIQKIIYYIAFYLCWVICVQQAAQGNGFIGPLVIAAVIAFHLWFVKETWVELIFILIVSFFGTILDSVYINVGFMHFKAGYETLPWIAPLWLTSLYALFAAAFAQSFGWLRGHWWRMIGFGAIGGTLSYMAAAKLGAAEFLVPTWAVCVVLGVAWGLIFPLCFILFDRLAKRMG